MAIIRNHQTRQQVLAKFRVLFPTWSVQLSGSELLALSPEHKDMSWTVASPEIAKLRTLSVALGIPVLSQRRSGRILATMDLRDLPE